MARRTKEAPGARRTKQTSGRFTPKGGAPSTKSASRATESESSSGRYTPPIPREYRSSHWVVPALMLACWGVGIIGIVVNYLGVLPGGTSNVYLVVGLVLIIVGFIVATRWR